MVFADLKYDFVFRRVFGRHPNILRGRLNAGPFAARVHPPQPVDWANRTAWGKR